MRAASSSSRPFSSASPSTNSAMLSLAWKRRPAACMRRRTRSDTVPLEAEPAGAMGVDFGSFMRSSRGERGKSRPTRPCDFVNYNPPTRGDATAGRCSRQGSAGLRLEGAIGCRCGLGNLWLRTVFRPQHALVGEAALYGGLDHLEVGRDV